MSKAVDKSASSHNGAAAPTCYNLMFMAIGIIFCDDTEGSRRSLIKLKPRACQRHKSIVEPVSAGLRSGLGRGPKAESQERQAALHPAKRRMLGNVAAADSRESLPIALFSSRANSAE